MKGMIYNYCASYNNHFNYDSIIECIRYLIDKYVENYNSQPTKIKLSALHFDILSEVHQNLTLKPVDKTKTTIFGLEFVDVIDDKRLDYTIMVYSELKQGV